MGTTNKDQERLIQLFQKPVHVDYMEKKRINPPSKELMGYPLVLCDKCYEYFSKDFVCVYCKGTEKAPEVKKTTYHKKLEVDYQSQRDQKEASLTLEKGKLKYQITKGVPINVQRNFIKKFTKTLKYLPDHTLPKFFKFLDAKFSDKFSKGHKMSATDKAEVRTMVDQISKDFKLTKIARKKIKA